MVVWNWCCQYESWRWLGAKRTTAFRTTVKWKFSLMGFPDMALEPLHIRPWNIYGNCSWTSLHCQWPTHLLMKHIWTLQLNQATLSMTNSFIDEAYMDTAVEPGYIVNDQLIYWSNLLSVKKKIWKLHSEYLENTLLFVGVALFNSGFSINFYIDGAIYIWNDL